MQFDDLQRLIKTRRSIRKWQEKTVPEELLVKALELATWAPNAGNQQNWYFYIILKREIIRVIADAVQASADRLASWPEAKEFGETAVNYRKYASFFRNAPAAVAVAATKYQSVADHILAAREKTDPSATHIRMWRNAAGSHIQSVGAVVGFLLLVLHQMGLGAVWMTGPIQAKEEIEKILGIPPEKDLITFIPIGYPAESPVPRERRALSEVSEIIR